MRDIRISRAESDRISAEVAAEYQRLVDACNRITDRDIEDWELQRAMEKFRRPPNPKSTESGE